MLYCGLIVHGLFSETLVRSPSAVLTNPKYVKKVVFPVELLPITQLGWAFFNTLIGLVLLCVFVLAKRQAILPTALLVPVVLAPLILLTGWIVTAPLRPWRVLPRYRTDDRSRDVDASIPESSVLSGLRSSAQGPRAPRVKSIDLSDRGLASGDDRRQPARLAPLAVYAATSIIVAAAGLWAFQKTRIAFADVV